MSASQIAIIPPKPIAPLNYSGLKGELRMVNGRLWRWDGRDWQPAVIDPADVTGLPVTQSDLVTAQATIDDLPRGHQFTSSNTDMGSWVSAEAYTAVGVAWTFTQLRKVLIKAEITIGDSGGSATGTTQARFRANLYPGAINMADPVILLDEKFSGGNAMNRHHLEWEIPSGWQAENASVYVMLTCSHSSGATGVFIASRAPSTPAWVAKYDEGAW